MLYVRNSSLGKILGKISNDSGGDNLKRVLENSLFFKVFIKLYKFVKKQTTSSMETSRTLRYIMRLKNRFFISPIKYGSAFIVVIILTNIVLFALFKNTMDKDIGLSGWIVRGMLLLVAFGGIFCEIELSSVVETSSFLKHLKRDIDKKQQSK